MSRVGAAPMGPTLSAHRSPRQEQRTRTEPSRRRGAHRFTVISARDMTSLTSLVPHWEELAAHALEPNVFYEHWMLLPALRAYGAGGDLGIGVVHSGAAPRGALAGLFPLRRMPRSGWLNIGAWRLWRHPHCYLCTPLVREDCAAECISTFLHWLCRESRAGLLELPCLCADGPFVRVLLDRCEALGLPHWTMDRYVRGLWRRPGSGAGGVDSAVSAALRRRLRRRAGELAARGRLEHLALGAKGDIGRWAEEFLRVEASGWKGECGSALACSEDDRAFFTEIVAAGFRRRRLLTLGLDYDGEPIARRCAFVAGDGSFAFKTAYDQRFARYSPGALLELDSLAQLEALPAVRWMDSCAAEDNSLINRISNGRRAIQSVSVAAGPMGRLVFAGQTLLRSARRRLWRATSVPAETRS
jgi:CelD/BcsL family acetyltransferase involved in cellulose biosynthesis